MRRTASVISLSVIALLALIGVATCSRSEPEVMLLPVKIVWSDNFRLVDSHGETYRLPRKAVGVSPLINNCFSLTEPSGAVSAYRLRADGTSTLIANGLKACGIMNAGYMPVITGDGVVAVMDAFGRPVFRLPRVGGYRVEQCSAMVTDGLLWFGDSRGLWGAVDMKSRVVVTPKYLTEPQFGSGYALAVEQGEGDNFEFSVIDTRGNETYSFPDGLYPVSYTMKYSMIACEDSQGRKCLVSVEGNIVSLPHSVKEIRDFSDKYVIFSDAAGLWGLMTLDGDVVISPKYSTISFGVTGELLVSNAQSYFITDYKGRRVADFSNVDEVFCIGGESATMCSPFGYVGRSGALFTLYDGSACRVGDDDFVYLDDAAVMSFPEPLSVDNAPEGTQRR